MEEIEIVDRVRTARTEELDKRILKISEGSHFIQTKTTHFQLPSYLQWLRQSTELKIHFAPFSWIPQTARSITGWIDLQGCLYSFYSQAHCQRHQVTNRHAPLVPKQIHSDNRVRVKANKHLSTGKHSLWSEGQSPAGSCKNSFWRTDVLKKWRTCP